MCFYDDDNDSMMTQISRFARRPGDARGLKTLQPIENKWTYTGESGQQWITLCVFFFRPFVPPLLAT